MTDFKKTIKKKLSNLVKEQLPSFVLEDHPKFADSLYELSRVLIELDENVQAKLLLDKMLSEYPSHTLSSKASALLQNL